MVVLLDNYINPYSMDLENTKLVHLTLHNLHLKVSYKTMKLSKANAMLSNIPHYVDMIPFLRCIYLVAYWFGHKLHQKSPVKRLLMLHKNCKEMLAQLFFSKN